MCSAYVEYIGNCASNLGEQCKHSTIHTERVNPKDLFRSSLPDYMMRFKKPALARLARVDSELTNLTWLNLLIKGSVLPSE